MLFSNIKVVHLMAGEIHNILKICMTPMLNISVGVDLALRSVLS